MVEGGGGGGASAAPSDANKDDNNGDLRLWYVEHTLIGSFRNDTL